MKAPNTHVTADAEVLNNSKKTITHNHKSATQKVVNINVTNALNANTPPYPVAKFSLVISDKPNLTKHYDLVDGNAVKTAAGKLSLGTAMTFTKPLDLMIDTITQQATAHHALIHGVSGYDKIGIVTKGNETENAISRSREHFSYGDNALLMFDHDPSERGKHYTFESCTDFLEMLAECYPDIADAAFVVKPSSSAGIALNGKLVAKQGGFHAYTVAKDGNDISRFANILFKRLIIKGYGHAFISKNGSVFVRTIFDNAIYRPEGLDYIAPAIVGEGLTINQPPPQKFEGGYLDTSLMPDLTEAEEALYIAEHDRLRDAAVEDAKAVRNAYLKQRSLRTGVPVEILAKQYDQGEQGAIDYAMPLTKNNGTQFSFQEVIANPSEYHDLSMRDPFEPEYGEDKAKLYINDDGRINVHSYCHGKHTYKLYKDGSPFHYDNGTHIKCVLPMQLIAKVPWSSHNRPLTDTGNAERFVDLADGCCRHIPEVNKFIVFIDDMWGYASDSAIELATKTVVRSILNESAACSSDQKTDQLISWQRFSESRSSRKNMLELVKGELSLPFSKIDENNDLIGCQNGVVDLQTQTLLPPNRDNFVVSKMAVSFDPEAMAPRFLRFIEEITDGDKQVARYLQCVFGMMLLGKNPKQIMLMLVGHGSNGKSLLLEIMLYIFGDYGVSVEPELFLESRNSDASRPRPEMVKLAGKRLCITSEPPKGLGLNENLVKRFTGSDTISARIPYAKEELSFRPNIVPIMISNHDVRIEGTDHGIWRRIKQIQFNVQFEPDKEKGLDRELLSERDGIFNWLLEGVKEYLTDGLTEPPAIVENTKRYRSSQDVVSEWISDCCLINQGDEKQKLLYDSYLGWCKINNYRHLVSRDLYTELRGKGFTVDRTKNGKPVVGLKLK